MLLNNALICLNIPEAEPKITVQVKWHLQILQIYSSIQNLAKHLKWSKKEYLAKSNDSLELFPKDTTKYFTGI